MGAGGKEVGREIIPALMLSRVHLDTETERVWTDQQS